MNIEKLTSLLFFWRRKLKSLPCIALENGGSICPKSISEMTAAEVWHAAIRTSESKTQKL